MDETEKRRERQYDDKAQCRYTAAQQEETIRSPADSKKNRAQTFDEQENGGSRHCAAENRTAGIGAEENTVQQQHCKNQKQQSNKIVCR